jgi:hypothetical protein
MGFSFASGDIRTVRILDREEAALHQLEVSPTFSLPART